MPMNVKYSVLSGKKRVKSVAELGKNLLSLMYQIYVCLDAFLSLTRQFWKVFLKKGIWL